MDARGTLEARLSGLRDGLAADGYELHIDAVSEDTARMHLTLAPGACSKCLIPKDMLVPMIEAELAGLSHPLTVDLAYPAE